MNGSISKFKIVGGFVLLIGLLFASWAQIDKGADEHGRSNDRQASKSVAAVRPSGSSSVRRKVADATVRVAATPEKTKDARHVLPSRRRTSKVPAEVSIEANGVASLAVDTVESSKLGRSAVATRSQARSNSSFEETREAQTVAVSIRRADLSADGSRDDSTEILGSRRENDRDLVESKTESDATSSSDARESTDLVSNSEGAPKEEGVARRSAVAEKQTPVVRRLHNPTPLVVAFVDAGVERRLQPGEAFEFTPGVVRYHRGGAFGEKETRLQAGFSYSFSVSRENGWNIEKSGAN